MQDKLLTISPQLYNFQLLLTMCNLPLKLFYKLMKNSGPSKHNSHCNTQCALFCNEFGVVFLNNKKINIDTFREFVFNQRKEQWAKSKLHTFRMVKYEYS